MKTWRVIGTLILALGIFLPTLAKAQFTFTTNNGAITITGYSGSAGDVIIPDYTNGLPVTEIAYNAFSYVGWSLTSVVIPNSVTNIGAQAFDNCINLTNVVIGTNVTRIGNAAFFNCRNLGSITIPTKVGAIPINAFSQCTSLTNVTIGSNVTSIGPEAFGYCPGLTSIMIPNSVTNIGVGAFDSCIGLTNITIPSSIIGIGDDAFNNCNGLNAILFQGNAPLLGGPSVFAGVHNATVYYLPGTTGWDTTFGGVPTALLRPPVYYYFTTNNGSITITGYAGSNNVVAIPYQINGLPVTRIGAWAFYSNHVTSVMIPDSVTGIADGVFFDCPSLTNVVIGSSVTSMGNWAFAFCTDLTSVNCRGNAPNLAGTDVFFGNAATIYYLTGTSGWTSNFGGHPATLWNPLVPFYYVTDNSTISIIEYTGSDATVVIPELINFLPVTSIADSAFYNSTNLVTITIPNFVASIESEAFGDCFNLAIIKIPGSVTNIGGGAFDGCKSLPAITVDDSNPAYEGLNGVLYDRNETTLVAYPGGGDQIYGIPNSVTNIGSAAFAGCGNLIEVKIGTNTTTIGDYAFAGCAGLSNLFIPQTTTNIGSGLVAGCASLTAVDVDSNNPAYISLNGVLFNKNETMLVAYPGARNGNYTIPNTVAIIESNAFSNCKSLEGITIPYGVNRIGDFAFSGCTNLTVLTIPSSVTSLGNEAFSSCTSLTNVTIGKEVASIGDAAFYDCTDLIAVCFLGNAPDVQGGFTFYLDSRATAYYLPGTVGWNFFGYGPPNIGGLPLSILALPYPIILDNNVTFGKQVNGFGFTICWITDLPVVIVEAATNLANPVWIPLATNTLPDGTTYFLDPQWTNYPNRFYRVTTP